MGNKILTDMFIQMNKAKNQAIAAKTPIYLKIDRVVEAAQKAAAEELKKLREEHFNLLVEQAQHTIDEAEYSGDKYVGGKMSAQRYMAMSKNADLFWDLCDRTLNRHHPSNMSKRGAGGSKGQWTGKRKTLKYKGRREVKYFIDPEWIDESAIPNDILHVNVYDFANDDVDNIILNESDLIYSDDIKQKAKTSLQDLTKYMYQCTEIHMYITKTYRYRCPEKILIAAVSAAKELFEKAYVHLIDINDYDYYWDTYSETIIEI